MITMVPGSELRPGDKIMHSKGRPTDADVTWRHVYTVRKKPIVSPGAWSLRCEVVTPEGESGRISVGPTEVVHIERKGQK